MTEIKELFIEHYEILSKYKNAVKKYDNLLEKKARLILNMQPKGIDYSKEPISGGTTFNKFDDFVIKLEKLDPDLQNARNEKDIQEYFLKKKELELKDSNEILDKIYYLKYIKRLKVKYIAINVSYSKMQVYRKLDTIEKMLQNVTNTMIK